MAPPIAFVSRDQRVADLYSQGSAPSFGIASEMHASLRRPLQAMEFHREDESHLVSAAFVGMFILAWSRRLSTVAKQAREKHRVVCRAARVFIDGREGTTGLDLQTRLEGHPGIELLSIDPGRNNQKDRLDALCSADAAVLCVPDAAAIETVKYMDSVGANTVLLDASTAHRVANGWVYGFPELTFGHERRIASSNRVSNPGCYSTGFISLIRPLVERGVLSPAAAVTVHAISGYSGGGQGLISTYEDGPHEPWGAYGFSLGHGHLAEMTRWTGLTREPLFCPCVGDFPRGAVISVPLRTLQLQPGKSAVDVHSALEEHYAGHRFVSVAPLNPVDRLDGDGFLRPDALNETNRLELFCFSNESKGTLWLLARMDNLGKGASGACVQNLNLTLGFPESMGLDE